RCSITTRCITFGGRSMRRYLFAGIWSLVFGSIVVGTIVIVGCGGSPLSGLHDPEQVMLLSIDGREGAVGSGLKAGEFFRGYPILGQVEINDAEQRRQLIAALKDGIARSDRHYWVMCFCPRHGLRVVENGKTVDYVICFQC